MINKKISFSDFCKIPEYQPLSFVERQVMYVLYNAEGALTEEEIVEGVRELEKELKVN